MTTPVSGGAIPIVTKELNGKFVIKDLVSGEYRLAIVANGYARQDYGPRIFPGSETGVRSPQPRSITRNSADAYWNRQSDNSRSRGNPLAVSLSGLPIKYTYNASGLKTFHSAGAARTDDRGESALLDHTRSLAISLEVRGPVPVAGVAAHPKVR